MLVHGQLVEPGHQQVGLAGLIVVQGEGPAGGEEIDDVKIVDIGDDVKSGTIAMGLLKPISFSATYLFEEIGRKLVQVFMMTVPILGGILLFQVFHAQSVPFNLVNVCLFFISCLMGYLLNFYFNLCFGFSAFVLKNLWGAELM